MVEQELWEWVESAGIADLPTDAFFEDFADSLSTESTVDESLAEWLAETGLAESWDEASAAAWASNILSGAGSGALTGAAAGPWGALIGGLVGGALGAVQTATQPSAPARPSPPAARPAAAPTQAPPPGRAPARPKPAPAPPRQPAGAPPASQAPAAPVPQEISQVLSQLVAVLPLVASAFASRQEGESVEPGDRQGASAAQTAGREWDPFVRATEAETGQDVGEAEGDDFSQDSEQPAGDGTEDWETAESADWMATLLNEDLSAEWGEVESAEPNEVG